MEAEPFDRRVDEYLERWEQMRAMGKVPDVDELCRDSPQHGPELKLAIERLLLWEEFEGRETPVQTLTEVAVPGSDQSRTESAEIPWTLDRYQLIEKIGEGGMGQVYKAFHMTMEKTVAVKILPTRAVDVPEKVSRFRKEIRVAGRLEHENIVHAYDASFAGGTHFLVMEFVEGEDLAKKVRREGRIPMAQAIDYTIQAARGLGYAHSLGIIHRDVKPSNLMVTPQGTIKLLDLGLARTRSSLLEADSSTDDGSSNARYFRGTAQYASPEQIYDGQRIDHRADIYSLGCTFFYLLTGRSPFESESMMGMLLAHRVDPIPSLQATMPGVPAELDAVLLRMLAKEPEGRYSSMTELIKALRKIDLLADVTSRDAKNVEIDYAEPMSGRRGSIGLASPVAKSFQNHRGTNNALTCVTITLFILGVFACGIVFKKKTTSGVLVVEIDQPGVELVVDGPILRITSPDSREPVEIEIKEGSHQLIVRKGGFESRTVEFTIKSGERTGVKVHLEKNDPLPVTPDLDHQVAEWLLSKGGEVKIAIKNKNGIFEQGDTFLKSGHPAGQLPLSEFHIVQVILSEKKCSDADLARIATLQHVDNLFIPDNPITGVGLKSLGGMMSLRFLQLDRTRILGVDLVALQHLAELEAISLSETRAKGSGISHLKNLRQLVVGPHADDEFLASVGTLPKLRDFDLTSDEISDEGLNNLRKLKLERFNLVSSSVTDAGLTVLQSLPNLKILAISCSQVTDEGFEPISRLRNVEYLDLRSTKVGIRGLTLLERLPSLSRLSLSGNHLDAAGINPLLGLKRLQNLTLFDCKATDSVIPTLTQMKQLQILEFINSDLTDEGLSILKKALPSCQILR